MRGYIYVIGSMEHFNIVKVGISRRPPQNGRLDELQTGSPFTLCVWGYFTVTRGSLQECERIVHSELMPYKLRGEWFKTHPRQVLSTVERITKEYNTILKTGVKYKAFCPNENNELYVNKLLQKVANHQPNRSHQHENHHTHTDPNDVFPARR